MDITPDQARAELARRELARRGVSVDQPVDYKQVVGSAIKNSFVKPAAFAKDLGTNPESMANMMPALLGTVGGISPVIGGATLGTGAGQGLRDAALGAMNKPIPSGWQHAGELGMSALSDVAAIPTIKKGVFGRQIGAIEKAQGVPPAQDIPSIPMATGAKTTGEFINDAVSSVKSSGGKGTPEYWLQIKDQVDRIYKLGKTEGLTRLDNGRLKWLSKTVQEGLNAAVPGREVPAQALADSQLIPRTLKRAYKATPDAVKKAVGIAGLGAAGHTGWSVISKLLGM